MNTPRFMLCGTNSGCGKTMITCGILQALVNRGMKVAAFKCGPDYIDPMFHSKVIGAKSRNLDSFFADENTVRWLMRHNSEGSDVSVMEGVMGYYDGISNTNMDSSFEIAQKTSSPAVLIINVAGMSASAAAMTLGFLKFREPNCIAGVILNRVSPMVYPGLKETIEKECGVRVYGFMPKSMDCAVESRHLGLVMPEEVEDIRQKLMRLADTVEKTIDLDGLLELSAAAPVLSCTEPVTPENGNGLTIAVARDEAFCFYYEDNLLMLQRAGCKLRFFSPLTDDRLPKAHGLLLGGGYPELYARELSKNANMRESVRAAIEGGMPCIAECGGFMYLHKTLCTAEGGKYPMCGIIDGEVYYTGHLGRFGYIELTAERDSLFGQAGMHLRGHEFHYFESTDTGCAFRAEKPVSGKNWQCVHGNETLVCGFPHYYFYSNPQVVHNFLQACRKRGDDVC